MNIIDKINEKQIRKDIPEFRVGDTVRVDYKIIEGKRERIQAFEGIVVAKRNGSVSETFTVRKISSGVGVERIFPVNSPKIDKITVVFNPWINKEDWVSVLKAAIKEQKIDTQIDFRNSSLYKKIR